MSALYVTDLGHGAWHIAAQPPSPETGGSVRTLCGRAFGAGAFRTHGPGVAGRCKSCAKRAIQSTLEEEA